MRYQVSQIALLMGAALFVTANAKAQVVTEIDDTLNETVRTSTADNGNPSDVLITTSGNIEFEFEDGAIGVILDSSNTFVNEGDILIEDSDNTIGVLVNPGLNTTVQNDGRISLIEDYDREDEDDDDDDDGPLAIGTGRTAILYEAGGTHTGSLVTTTGSSITVEGNDSAAIRILDDFDGDITLDGSISVIGSDAVGLDFRGEITGDALLSTSVSVRGENAVAINVEDSVGGALTLEGVISATGFTSTSTSNYVAPANVDEDTDPIEERRDPDDLLVGGPAVAVGGSVANGILINGRIDDFISEEDQDDETKDTIEDFDENRATGSITSTGSAPALLIDPDWGTDGATEDLVLGTVVETVRDTLDDDDDDDTNETLAVFEYEYGFINRGGITARGLNVGFDALALSISGSEDGLYSTIIEGGMYSSGSITASANEANATAVQLGSGADVGTFVNEGSISASIATVENTQATAILIEEGANLTTLENSGGIQASSQGNAGEVATIVDETGDLTTIYNTGSLDAFYQFDGLETDIREDAVVLDLRANTSGVTITQEEAIPTDDVNDDDVIDGDDVADPRILGQILFGSGDDTLTSTFGLIDGDIDFAAGANTLSLTDTEYEGDVTFSGTSGDVSLSGEETSFDGDLNYLSGANSLTLLDTAVFEGDIFSSGDSFDLSVQNAELRLGSSTQLEVDTLSFSDGSIFEVTIDPNSTETAPILDAEGTADLGADTQVRVVYTTTTDVDFRRTLIAAPEITFDGAFDSSQLIDTPFIYITELELIDGDTSDQLDLVYRLKTPEDLGLDVNQAAAYDSVIEVFNGNEDLGFALASISNEEDFFQVYNQVLPQRSEASTRYLSAQATSAFGSLADRLNMLAQGNPEGGRVWIQEHFTAVDIEDDVDSPGYNGDGFGFSLGIDSARFGFDAVGLMATFSSGDFEEKTGGNNPVSTSSFGLGLYAQEKLGPVTLRGAAQVSSVDFNSTREIEIIIGEDDNLNTDDALDDEDLESTLKGSWGGLSAAATLSAQTEFSAGAFYARPELSVDYFWLSQDAYTETADRRDELALAIGESETDRLSAAAILALGLRFETERRDGLVWGPELRLGYRSELSSTPYEVDAQYLGASSGFQIVSQEIYEDAALVGLSLASHSRLFTARLTYDAEFSDSGVIHYAGASVSYRF